MVLKTLNVKQNMRKEIFFRTSSETVGKIWLLGKTVTGDETWTFEYNQEKAPVLN
jgi:hypothetical protein